MSVKRAPYNRVCDIFRTQPDGHPPIQLARAVPCRRVNAQAVRMIDTVDPGPATAYVTLTHNWGPPFFILLATDGRRYIQDRYRLLLVFLGPPVQTFLALGRDAVTHASQQSYYRYWVRLA